MTAAPCLSSCVMTTLYIHYKSQFFTNFRNFRNHLFKFGINRDFLDIKKFLNFESPSVYMTTAQSLTEWSHCIRSLTLVRFDLGRFGKRGRFVSKRYVLTGDVLTVERFGNATFWLNTIVFDLLTFSGKNGPAQSMNQWSNTRSALGIGLMGTQFNGYPVTVGLPCLQVTGFTRFRVLLAIFPQSWPTKGITYAGLSTLKSHVSTKRVVSQCRNMLLGTTSWYTWWPKIFVRWYNKLCFTTKAGSCSFFSQFPTIS